MSQRTHSGWYAVPEDGIQQVDMLGHGPAGRTLEIHTDAGIIRVNTGLEDTRTRVPVVTVEIEPNMQGLELGLKRTEPGGHWVTELSDWITSTRIRLTKDG